jgi:hypothetical protein
VVAIQQPLRNTGGRKDMGMKKSTGKMTLSRETLLTLTENRLQEVPGGITKYETCGCPTSGPTSCSRLC